MMNEKALLSDIFDSIRYKCYPNTLDAKLSDQFTSHAFESISQQMLDKGVIVTPGIAGRNAMFNAIIALIDLVNAYSDVTTFRRKDAIQHSNDPTIKSAFTALWNCGCELNSNDTICLDKLTEFRNRVEGMKKELTRW